MQHNTMPSPLFMGKQPISSLWKVYRVGRRFQNIEWWKGSMFHEQFHDACVLSLFGCVDHFHTFIEVQLRWVLCISVPLLIIPFLCLNTYIYFVFLKLSTLMSFLTSCSPIQSECRSEGLIPVKQTSQTNNRIIRWSRKWGFQRKERGTCKIVFVI